MDGNLPPNTAYPKKRKWAAALLSAMFPGLGHMYAGKLQRGLLFMLLLVCNIFGLVMVSMQGIVPLIILLALIIPVVYFYTLFDSLQMIDRINHFQDENPNGPRPFPSKSFNLPQVLFFGLAIACILFWTVGGRVQWIGLWDKNGSLFGSILLIGIGILIYFVGRWKK